MDIEEIRKHIHKIVDDNNLLPGGNIIEDAASLKEYGLDSIGIVDLIATIEEEYEFEFDNNDLELDNFKSIIAIADLVQHKMESGESV